MGNCLFLLARGWGIDRQVRKKLQIPGGVPGGEMVTGRIEPCITDHHALNGCYVALCWSCFCTFNTQVCRRGLLLFYKLTSALIAGRECYLMFK